MQKANILRWICFSLMSLFLSGGLTAQDQKMIPETKKEASQRKKEERQAKIESQYKQMNSLLKGKKFVLEAHFLKTTSGDRFPVSATLNFISVDSLSAVIQVGSFQRVGYNGVGGVTMQGKISNWKLEKDDKRKNFYLTMTVRGDYNTYDVTMSIDYSGYSDATLNGIRAGNLTFNGNVVSKEETIIFKGQKH
jgi:hypothetical protein